MSHFSLHTLFRAASAIRFLVGAVLLTLLAACGSGNNENGAGGSGNPGASSAALDTGRFIDAPVQGLSYTQSVWTAREINRSWLSVASSADGSKLVAVAINDKIYTSTDSGASWTPRESNRNWRSVASSADGSKLVAVVSGGQIYTSANSGASWTPRESNRDWWSVASSEDGSKLVAVATEGRIYTSTDSGATWTPRESNRGWLAVASSADGSKLVATTASSFIYTSTDSGNTWTERSIMYGTWHSVASSADGNKLVVANHYGKIITSTDSGVSWTEGKISVYWNSVASSSDGSRLVAVINNQRIYISADSGASWTAQESDRAWRSVASSADGSKLVAVDYDGRIYTYGQPTVQQTNAAGEYACFPGSDVTLSLGNQVLGAVKCGKVAHVYQMAGTGQTIDRGIRIARLLQSLDMTPASTDNIQLPDLSSITVNVRFETTDAEFEADANALIAQLKARGRLPAANTLVSSAQAQAHVRAELLKLSEAERVGLCEVNYCKSELLRELAAPLGVGGSVSGLPANKEIRLQLTSPSVTQVLSVGVNGTYGFVVKPAVGQTYTVARIDTDPSLSCTLANASGTMPAQSVSVSNVNVTCSEIPARTGTLGGTVSGLGAGQNVTLQVSYSGTSGNPSQTLRVSSNGGYVLHNAAPGASRFAVRVQSAVPASMSCTIANGAGESPRSFTTGFAISDVNVTCVSTGGSTPTFSVGGTVSGLPNATNIALTMTSNDSLANNQPANGLTNGAYTFVTPVTSSSSFSIATTSPAGYSCTVAAPYASSTVITANVTNANITCASTGGGGGNFTEGTINGQVTNNSALTRSFQITNGQDQVFADDVGPNSSASFTLPAIAPGTAYTVAAEDFTDLPNGVNPLTCNATNASGTMVAAPGAVSNVAVTCQ
jgi:photosystem II stability/assembly factor-like uncharacterized protein